MKTDGCELTNNMHSNIVDWVDNGFADEYLNGCECVCVCARERAFRAQNQRVENVWTAVG